MALTPLQLKFIDEYSVTQQKRDSAIRAGYAPGSAHVRANECLNNPEIVTEIRRRVELSFVEFLAEARDVITGIMRSGGKDDAVRLKAAEHVLNRGGLLMKSLSEHHVVVEHVERHPVSTMLLAEIKRLAAR